MTKKLTTAEFIKKAQKVHGKKKYSYGLVQYNGSNKKVTIYCNKCKNTFEQISRNHLNGQGCSYCAEKQRSNTKKLKYSAAFESKARKVHGNKFSYHLVKYITSTIKVNIYCNICNNIFEQQPNNHLSGKGCPHCQKITLSNLFSSSKNEFIAKAKKIHGDKYDYNLVKYKNTNTKVKLFCVKCNEYFMQAPAKHLSGQGCAKCGGKLRSNNSEFILKAKKVHGPDTYNYELIKYKNNRTKIKIYCNECKCTFEQTPSSHLSGRGCPHCHNSRGESIIKNILTKYNITYAQEHRFKNCVYKKPLPFDFFISTLNILIEFDGEQHFNKSRLFKRSLKETQKCDAIKTKWAADNGYTLVRIPYTHIDHIEEMLLPYIT